jgi:hypothetical protein
VAAEKATRLVGDRVEHARLRRVPGHQLGHAPQGGLLVGEASEIGVRARHADHDARFGAAAMRI